MNQPKAIVLGVGPEAGLGGALCKKFAREGMHVFVAGRTESKLANVCDVITKAGGTATPVVCDAVEESQVCALFQAVKNNGPGELELAVFNVGNNMPGKILDMEAGYFEDAWRMGAYAGFLFGRGAAGQMLPAGGTILYTGASASLRGRPGFSAFNSSKSALRTFVQAFAKEHAKDGLHVAHVIIDGGIAGDKIRRRMADLSREYDMNALIALEGLADAYWYLHQQTERAWTFELDLRTRNENW